MKLLYVALLLIGSNHVFAHPMHGGVIYQIEKVPYLAQLNSNFEGGLKSHCGAAILSDRWILTAAHCIHEGEEHYLFLRVRFGTSKTLAGGKMFKISKIIQHNGYSVETKWNDDICLIEFEEQIEFDDKIQPISISKSAPRVGSEITLAGYGDDGDVQVWDLKMGHQTVITQEDCREAYKNAPQGNIVIDDRAFCTDSTVVDGGGGDSGSPGVLNGKVVGIAVEASETPLPNIYVNVAYYYDWIVDNTDIEFDEN